MKADFEERVLLTVPQPGPSDRPMQWVQHRWQCGSSPKGKKPPVLASLSVPWDRQQCSVLLRTSFVIWLLDLWELMFSHPTSFSPDYQFWTPLAAPTRQNDVKKEHSFLCHSMSPFHRQSDLLLAPLGSIGELAQWGRSLLGWSHQMIALDTSSFGAPSSSKISWVPPWFCITKGRY